MGAVYKKTATKPLPANAKIVEHKGVRVAEWLDGRGRRRKAPVTIGKDGSDRLVITAKTYTAKYRDGAGVVREVATGCRDEAAARSRLSELERRAEMVKGGILSADEAATIDHQEKPIAEHIVDFLGYQETAGVVLMHRENTRRRLQRIVTECNFTRLGDFDATVLEKWLFAQQGAGMGAATRNGYRESWVTFGNWCVRNRRIVSNPFTRVPKADAKVDPRRKRRSLTEDELRRLLEVTRSRPLLDAMTIRWGSRKGELARKLREETRCRLERLGRERALIYKTLVLTGLRKGELASIAISHVVLDAEVPYLILKAADEKNREGSTIPLRADLADDLRQWLAEKAMVLQKTASSLPADGFDAAKESNSPELREQTCLPVSTIPTLPPNTPLFAVPTGLVQILDRDLVAAGIAHRVEVAPGKWKIDKRDERGRTIDVHALRHTFGTHLSKGGVSPRTAQAAMRHSKIDLTMNVYTDPKLLDVAGAIKTLPSLSLRPDPQTEVIAVNATGTEGFVPSEFAPEFAPTAGQLSILESALDNAVTKSGGTENDEAFDVSAYAVNRKDLLTTAVNRSLECGKQDLNLHWFNPTRPST